MNMNNNDRLQVYFGYKGDIKKKRKCAQCGEEYDKYHGEVEYLYRGKHFCSYNCRSKYKKLHPEVEKQDENL